MFNIVYKQWPSFNVIDIDNGVNGTEGIRYSLVPMGNFTKPDIPFDINNKTGVVSVAHGTLDRETTSEYDIMVRIIYKFYYF